jgi:cyclic-di-GMP-binding protein
MPSFDVVSEVDMQEVRNAVDQANREISNRFDFKGSDARAEQQEGKLILFADDEFKIGQARDILQLKLSKRSVDIGCLQTDKVEIVGGNKARQEMTVRQGIDTELAKKIVKLIKDSKLKVQAAIQGDRVRVTGKKRDDLQAVITLLRQQKLGLPLQYINFRE